MHLVFVSSFLNHGIKINQYIPTLTQPLLSASLMMTLTDSAQTREQYTRMMKNDARALSCDCVGQMRAGELGV